MAKFITIGYGDRAGYDRTPPEVRDAAHAHDNQLVASGVLMGRAGHPVQVRNTNGECVSTKPVAYMRSDLPIVGFAVVEAATIDDAVALVAGTPCAVAHGVVEVWPFVEDAPPAGR